MGRKPKQKIETEKLSEKPKRKYTKRKKNIIETNENDVSIESIKDNDLVNQNPYTEKNYIENLKFNWVHPSKLALERANNELGTKYNSWDELSLAGNLSEEFIIKYQNEINWYNMFKKQKEFSDKFTKKFKDKFIIIRLGLI